MPVLIDGPIDIPPTPRHFEIRFIDRPACAHPAPIRFRRFLIPRNKLLDPVEEGGGV